MNRRNMVTLRWFRKWVWATPEDVSAFSKKWGWRGRPTVLEVVQWAWSEGRKYIAWGIIEARLPAHLLWPYKGAVDRIMGSSLSYKRLDYKYARLLGKE